MTETPSHAELVTAIEQARETLERQTVTRTDSGFPHPPQVANFGVAAAATTTAPTAAASGRALTLPPSPPHYERWAPYETPPRAHHPPNLPPLRPPNHRPRRPRTRRQLLRRHLPQHLQMPRNRRRMTTWRCHICHQTGTGNYHQHYKKQHHGRTLPASNKPKKEQ